MTQFVEPDRVRQVVDFEGMNMGTATPTDVDAWVEYHNKAHLFYEFKHSKTRVKDGQRLALERLVTDCERSGKPAVAFVCEHYTNPTDVVMAKDSKVREFFYKGEWHNGFRRSLLGWTKRFTEMIDGTC